MIFIKQTYRKIMGNIKKKKVGVARLYPTRYDMSTAKQTNYKLMSNNSLISSEEGLGALVEITFPSASNNMNLGIPKMA